MKTKQKATLMRKWLFQLVITSQHTATQLGNLLADASVTCEHVSVLKHGLVGWCVRADLEHTSPLGKTTPIFLVLGTALTQTIQTCG